MLSKLVPIWGKFSDHNSAHQCPAALLQLNLLTGVGPLIPPLSDFEGIFSQCPYALASLQSAQELTESLCLGLTGSESFSPTVQGRASMPQTLLLPTISCTWAAKGIKGCGCFPIQRPVKHTDQGQGFADLASEGTTEHL